MEGVWIVYFHDVQLIVHAVYADELEARRNTAVWMSVKFVKFGEPVA